jgi:hypothetical protein
MRGKQEEGGTGPRARRWRTWGHYAMGIVIESAAVGAISLAALGLMFLIKVLVT